MGFDDGGVYRFEGPNPAPCGRVSAPAETPAVSLARPAEPTHGSLLLSAKRLRPGGSRFRVKARLAPCHRDAGLSLQLTRNGKGFASRRLDRRCRASFLLTVVKPTPLRAFVLVAEGNRISSRRLLLQPPPR